MKKRDLHTILKGIMLASAPLIGLHGCGTTTGGGNCLPPPTSYPLTPEEVNAIAAALPDGEISRNSDGGNTMSCEFLCQPPEQRDAGRILRNWYGRCEVGATSDGQPTIDCWEHYACIGGRRPEAFAPGSNASPCATGAWLARMAQLEAASVPAFQRLRAELLLHDAPIELIHTAEQAIRDERRHAYTVGRLARAHGAKWEKPQSAQLDVRSLESVALENATEGCVRETFGAMQALWQAQAARDPEIRAAMQVIAEEETRHAELAWAVDAWAAERLSPEARSRIEMARSEAMEELRAELSRQPPLTVVDELGVPDARASTLLFEQLRAQLWT